MSNPMTLKLRKVGNSLGVTLPREALETLHVGEGDTLTLVRNADGSFNLTPYNPEFSATMEAFERTRRKYRNALRELSR